MMEKITASFKQHCSVANATLVVAVACTLCAAVFLVFWLAIIFGVGDRVLPLVNAALSPTNAPLAVAVVLTALAVALFSIWLSVKEKYQMTKKITESKCWCRAGFMLVVVVALLFVLLGSAIFSLWFAKKIGIRISYEFLPLVNAVLSPTVTAVCIVAGVFIWLVNKFTRQIGDLINRLRKGPGGIEFDKKQRPVSESESAATDAPVKAKADEGLTEKIPASDSDSADKDDSGVQSETAKTASAETDAPTKAKADEGSTEKIPAAGSVAADKEENGAKPATAKTASAGDFLAEIKGKAAAGEAAAQFNFGRAYHFGNGIEQDDVEAVKWYRRAAEQGNIKAQHNLGWMYANGRGVERDNVEAVKWYRLAVEQGDVKAQNNLGWMYANGRGVNLDDAEAVKWYRRAAEQGNATAQNNLGVMYANGQGVEQDDAEATKWYRLSAEQGNATAQNNLGVSYHNGTGVAQNYREAYIWHSIAAANGVKSSVQNRNDDAKMLSADDLAKAQAEATRRMEKIRKRAENGK